MSPRLLHKQHRNLGAFSHSAHELSRKIKEIWAKGIEEFENNFPADKSILLFLVPVFVLAWLLERWLLHLSSWVPVCVAAFAAFQYGRYKRNILLEDLNNRWKRHILYTSPKTPLEPCEWLNKLMITLWPNFIEPKLSNMFSASMLKRLKEKKPHPFSDIELQEFSFGTSPPALGLQRTYWTTEGDEQVLYMGFEWDTKEMKVLLAAKAFTGIARFIVNSLYVKGDLRIVSILDGQAVVFSFSNPPEVRIGLAFGSGQSLPATELPVVTSWLERLFSETLNRTMVEPRRKCIPLPAVSLKKHVTGGIISVTVSSGEKLDLLASLRGLSDKRPFTNGNGSTSSSFHSKHMSTFVEVTLGGLTRKTQVSQHYGSTRWDDIFNMILHESSDTIHFNVYQQGPSNVKYDFLGSCELRVKYVHDGSTIFWSTGPNKSVLADRAENCGKEVVMQIPIDGCDDAKLSVKLLVKEWQFTDGSRTAGTGALSGSLSSLPSFEPHTGRTLKITVHEGRNLAPKDRSGKSDPYVRLRYGKLECKTQTVKQDLNPLWKQSFEFPEIGGGEYLQLKCYDADYLTDESLGSARVNLEGLEDGVSRDVWIPLEKINTGEIRLSIEAYTSESEMESGQNGSRGEHNVDPEIGILEVVLIEARELVAADWRGTRDPFVSIQCGSRKWTTKVIQRTLHPQWNQTFKLYDNGEPLLLYVKDHKFLLPPFNIGHCKVEYERLPKNQTVNKWIPLQGVRKGEIHVRVTRQLHNICSGATQHGTFNTHSNLLKKSGKVRTLLKQVRSLASRRETDTICKMLDEIGMAEDEKGAYISQLLREKELLLVKIKELGRAMEVIQDNF